MGDAGSTYLGFMIAYAALVTVAGGCVTAWQWLILGGLFLADATLTLARRTLRREAIFSAHRLHAYQHLARRWRSHRRVSTLYLAVNLVLLLPLARWAGLNPVAAPVAALAAYVALGAGLLWAGAGAAVEKPSSASGHRHGQGRGDHNDHRADDRHHQHVLRAMQRILLLGSGGRQRPD